MMHPTAREFVMFLGALLVAGYLIGRTIEAGVLYVAEQVTLEVKR